MSKIRTEPEMNKITQGNSIKFISFFLILIETQLIKNIKFGNYLIIIRRICWFLSSVHNLTEICSVFEVGTIAIVVDIVGIAAGGCCCVWVSFVVGLSSFVVNIMYE